MDNKSAVGNYHGVVSDYVVVPKADVMRNMTGAHQHVAITDNCLKILYKTAHAV